VNRLKKIVSWGLAILIGLVLVAATAQHSAAVQSRLGKYVAESLSKKLSTDVKVGKVFIGLSGHVTVDSLQIADQQGGNLLSTDHVVGKLSLKSLLKGKVDIVSAQIFKPNIRLIKPTADGQGNWQFALDSLKSKNPDDSDGMKISVGSLVIRDGQVAYDIANAPPSKQFTTDHLHISDLDAHLTMGDLSSDTIRVSLKKASLKEASGLQLDDAAFNLTTSNGKTSIENLLLKLPNSKIAANAEMDKGDLKLNINESKITPSDLAFLNQSVQSINEPISLSGNVQKTAHLVRIENLEAHAENGLDVDGYGTINTTDSPSAWQANVKRLSVSDTWKKRLAKVANLDLPDAVDRLGDIAYEGKASGKGTENLKLAGDLSTSCGNATIDLAKNDDQIKGHLRTNDLNLKRVLDANQLGTLTADVDVDGTLRNGVQTAIKGDIKRIDYNGYPFENISVDGRLDNGVYEGNIAMNDKNGQVDFVGTVNLDGKTTTQQANEAHISVRDFNPTAMHLTGAKWKDAKFSFDADGTIDNFDIKKAQGQLHVSNFQMKQGDTEYTNNSLLVSAVNDQDGRHLHLDSDFGEFDIDGHYDYNSLLGSLEHILAQHLPTLPGINKQNYHPTNEFNINATLTSSDMLQFFADVPLELQQPIHIEGTVNDKLQTADLIAEMPSFVYKGKEYRDGYAKIQTVNDTLRSDAQLLAVGKENNIRISVQADAADNKLRSKIFFNADGERPIGGVINANTQFSETINGALAQIDVEQSEIQVNDSIWTLSPATISYQKNRLIVDNLSVAHDKQYININGAATTNHYDTLAVHLKDVDVSYMLDLVDFDAVSFSGKASGKAIIAHAFDKPDANASVQINDFLFQTGRMGTLNAQVNLNNDAKQIDINAQCVDEQATTDINGFISPQRNEISLDIDAHNSRAEFLQGFCGSFMQDIGARLNGSVNLGGALDAINLTGLMVANGPVGITPLNTMYALRNDTIRLYPNIIQFERDTVYDINENTAIVNGQLLHDNLKNLRYNLNIDAEDLLAFDHKDFGENTFCGTVYATGNCKIRGKSGETIIDVDATPEKDSEITYNAASPDAIVEQSFIHWSDRDANDQPANPFLAQDDDEHIQPSFSRPEEVVGDLRLNMLIHANPDLTLKVLMDESSGDYIALNGDGGIRANYYNKGPFQLFGNYKVDHGIYKLTIQNVIKKDFQFLEGGTISFGGEPYDAALNLKAQYTVTGVSLSDLNIGKSFTSNNIRVNCMMNITGTPNQPKADFELDFPTINSDAKQMIYSLITSEQEMNQQVLYLLAVGRFYAPSTNNAQAESATQQNQASLAMQSILSGTISQQLNNVLSNVIKNTNWNFGANISTGDEGFNNAEYEGLLSGRLLNNRLLINGQFGYRDNANATTSFIGDFDIQYLLRPNGNLAIKVYNQTNDRYFTRNSLTTQGVGFILKKDFNNWKELFKKDKTIKKSKNKRNEKKEKVKSKKKE